MIKSFAVFKRNEEVGFWEEDDTARALGSDFLPEETQEKKGQPRHLNST